MSILLQNLNLHDSDLLKIEICEKDVIILHINYIENYETFNTVKRFLVFKNCLKAQIDANFGISSHNSILDGKEIVNSDILNLTISKWEKFNIPINKLRHFLIETNSTNSTINIIAGDVLFLDSLESIKFDAD